MPKRFQKRVEDFVCVQCGFPVAGTGYTDHCPRCLWSKHQDVNPGDRQSGCHGLMEPIGAEMIGGEYVIYYKCLKCRHRFKVKAAVNDNIDEIIKLSTGYA